MALHRLKFDTTDTDTIAASPSVGAYVRASDGTLITSTGTALDVSIANTSIEVTATDLDIRPLTNADVVTVEQGTDPWTVDGSVGITGDVNVTQGTSPWVVGDGGGSLTVDFTRLAAATDSVTSWLNDGSGNAITSTAGALDVNLKSPVVVDTDLDGIYHVTNNANPDNVGSIFHSRAASIGDAQQVERTTAGAIASIAAASISNINAMDVNSFPYGINDSSGDAELFSIADATGGLKVDVQNAITVQDVALANVAIKVKANQLDTADTNEDVIASGDVLTDRKYLWLFNQGRQEVYIGENGFAFADGFPIPSGSILEMRLGAAVDIEFVGESGKSGVNAELRTLQAS